MEKKRKISSTIKAGIKAGIKSGYDFARGILGGTRKMDVMKLIKQPPVPGALYQKYQQIKQAMPKTTIPEKPLPAFPKANQPKPASPKKILAKKHPAKHKKGGKFWIAKAISKPGALHRQLGVKKGTKIPASRLVAAAKKGGKLGRRARLAQTLKEFKHTKKVMKCHKCGAVIK